MRLEVDVPLARAMELELGEAHAGEK